MSMNEFMILSLQFGGELCCYTQRMRQLGFSGTELSENLCDAHCFNTTAQQCIQFRTACGDLYYFLWCEGQF